MPIYEIDDIDDPRLAVYRDLPRARRRARQELFIVEGRMLVERLWASEFETDSVLTDESHRELSVSRCDDATPIYVTTKALLEQIIGFSFHRGLLACGRRRRPAPSFDEFIRSAPARAVLTVCEQVADQENMGGIIRNSLALGSAGILLGPGCADPFSRRVLRVSMGAAFALTPMESSDLRGEISQLRQAGFHLVAAMVDRGATELAECARPARVAVVFGNEGHGLSQEWRDLCDEVVTIPMRGGVDSLNVAAASAVFLHHFADR